MQNGDMQDLIHHLYREEVGPQAVFPPRALHATDLTLAAIKRKKKRLD